MIFWVLAALLAAFTTAFVVGPLWGQNRRLALLLIIVIPLLALGIYFFIGNPGLAG